MVKYSYKFIVLTLFVLLQAGLYGTVFAADNCPAVTSEAPGLTQNCNAFYTTCTQQYSGGEAYCQEQSQVYILGLDQFRNCTGSGANASRCSSFDEEAERLQLIEGYGNLVPWDRQWVPVGGFPDMPEWSGSGTPGATNQQQSNSTNNTSSNTTNTSEELQSGTSGATSQQQSNSANNSPSNTTNTSIGNSNGSLGYVPLAPLTGDKTSPINPEQYLPFLFDLLIGVSALLAIVMIVVGGITYMTSDVFSQKSHGKETITNALWGLLLVISAYMILYTVNPDLLKFRLSFPMINNPGWQAPVGGSGSNWFVTPACREARNCGVLPRSGGGRGDSVCAEGNSACSPEAIESAGLPWEQAVTMSCIAMTENSGSPVGCSGTGPCGTFQISQENWRAYAPSDCSGLSNQNNADCNLRTAVIMVRRLGYQPWTGNNNGVAWNTAASTCVNNYDAGTSLRR